MGYPSTPFIFEQNGNSSNAQYLCERRLALQNLPQPNWHLRNPKEHTNGTKKPMCILPNYN